MLRERVEELANRVTQTETVRFTPDDRSLFEEFKRALNRGEIRAAEKTSVGEWGVNSWVKQGILLGFRMGALTDMSGSGLHFFDKDTYPLHPMTVADNVRIVPGGSSIRD